MQILTPIAVKYSVFSASQSASETNMPSGFVSVISPMSQQVKDTVVKGLSQWKYRPVLDGDTKVPACFATTFRLRVD